MLLQQSSADTDGGFKTRVNDISEILILDKIAFVATSPLN